MVWTKEFDENSQLHYYVSSRTGESQWAVPNDGMIEVGNTARSPTVDKTALHDKVASLATPKRKKKGARRSSLFDMKLQEIENKDHTDLLDGF